MSEITQKCLWCGDNKFINKIASKSKFDANPFSKNNFNPICKDCKKTIDNLEKFKLYLSDSEYEFSQVIWDRAYDEIFTKLQNQYKGKSLPKNFDKTIIQKSIGKYFSLLNLPQNSVIKNKKKTKEENDERLYSEKWKGAFSEGEINYLEDYVSSLMQDYNIITKNHMDYAMKIAKASLAMDNAYKDILDGLMGAEKKYEIFKKIFDDLCKSAQFTESSRSMNDVVGLGSMGVIVKRIEDRGFVPTNFDFDIEDDNVEKTLNDYKYIVTSSSLGV